MLFNRTAIKRTRLVVAFQHLKTQTMTNITTPNAAQAVAPTHLYDATGAAERLGIKPATFRNRVRAGKYPAPIRVSPKRPKWTEETRVALIQSL